MKSFLKIFCVLVGIVTAYGNYCSMDCPAFGVKHIGCNHKNSFDAGNCVANPKLVKMSGDLKKFLIDSHNEKRNLVAKGGVANHGKACRMATMKWDDELEKLAVLNVYQCNPAHDWCHNTQKFKYSGQNLYLGFRSPIGGEFDDKKQLGDAINGWFDEHKASNQRYIDKFPNGGPKIGHFTVMSAERNTHLGCAAATYEKQGKMFYLLACNYATDNIIDNPIYTTCPAAASGCSSKNRAPYENLCSESEKYDYEI